MAPLTATTPQAWDIYVQELRGLGYGYPMWSPGPDPKYGKIELGDIGFIEDGRFHLLFNCLHTKDHGSHGERGERLPQSFVPLGSVDRYRRGPDVAITESTVGGITKRPPTRDKTVETFVASLQLKPPARRTFLDCRDSIEEYMNTHGDTWLEFFQREDIAFVYGHTMTTEWTVSAYVPEPVTTPENSSSSSAILPKMLRKSASTTPSKLTTERGRTFQGDDSVQDQCIFLDLHIHRKARSSPVFFRLFRFSRTRAVQPPKESEDPADSTQSASTPGDTFPATSAPPSGQTLSPESSGTSSADERASSMKASNTTSPFQ